MNPQEDQGLELAKEGVKELLTPVTDVLRDLLGPAAKEIGLGLGDSFRVWRLKRIVRLLEDVRQIASRAGLRLKPVAPRILFPLLEAASLEDDEDLHQRWAALLTNAASPEFDARVLPPFPDILSHLTSIEAQFLDRAFDEVTQEDAKIRVAFREGNPGITLVPLVNSPISEKTLAIIQPVMVENLERLMLLSRTGHVSHSPEQAEVRNIFLPANHLYITQFGRAFVQACRLPRETATAKPLK